MDFSSTVSDFQRIFELVTNNPWSSILAVIGFVLLAFGVGLGGRALKTDPASTPPWLKFGLFFCLIGGVAFVAAGSIVGLIIFSKVPIERVPLTKAFDNLETNERVQWLIRLIPFDPDNANDFANLAIGHLKQLGPQEQKYTFVAAYDELVGYGVDEAVRMTGGTYYKGERVSAIIFPLMGRQIYPANARGLLQVIQNIETDSHNQIATPLLKDTNVLSPEETADLPQDKALNDWRWENYIKFYPDYCRLAQTFRCSSTYSAHAFLSGPNPDWHPLGLAQKNTKKSPCGIPTSTYCEVSDPKSAHKSWQSAEAALMPNFGSRVFLIDNLTIDTIKDRVLIDFGEPDKQFIPDIGLRTTAR